MRSLHRYVVAIVIVVGAIAGRMFYEGRNEWREGERALSAGHLREAVIHFDRSVHWYFPGNPYPEQSLDRLLEIAKREEAKNPLLALLAYDSMRGGIYSIRSLISPFAERLSQINERIAQLRSEQQVREHPGTSLEEALSFHRRVLAKDERPNQFWVVIAVFGFFGWVSSVLALIWKGFDREGKMHIRPSLPWIFSFLGCFICWIAGLLKA